VIGTYGEIPIALNQIIQSTHIPLFFFDRERLGYLGFDATRGRVRHLARGLYVLVARLIANWKRAPIERNRLLTNSMWTARQFRRCYPHSQPRTLYPGATTQLPISHPTDASFERRSENCVILGRIVPSKRVEMAIEIVDLLRARGLQVGLTIIGGGKGAYARSIVELSATRPYVTLHSNLSRVEMEELASTHKWGIHCAPNEHYGLAAIELIRLGCIVFVPNNGGQAEVVNDDRLRYSDATDAADKMERVLRSRIVQLELRELLSRVAEIHTIEQFQSNFLQYVLGVLNEQPKKD